MFAKAKNMHPEAFTVRKTQIQQLLRVHLIVLSLTGDSNMLPLQREREADKRHNSLLRGGHYSITICLD